MHAAITAVGNDRPGIVAAISRVIFESGGNLEDSRMAILGGHFAVVLIVAVREGTDLGVLEADLSSATATMDLTISVRPVADVSAAHAEGGAYTVRVYGSDRPGIVAEVSGMLARHDVNIADLATHMVGGDPPVYVMLIDCLVPTTGDALAFERDLTALAAKLGVEVSVEANDAETL